MSDAKTCRQDRRRVTTRHAWMEGQVAGGNPPFAPPAVALNPAFRPVPGAFDLGLCLRRDEASAESGTLAMLLQDA